jgi:hypothetical protein
LPNIEGIYSYSSLRATHQKSNMSYNEEKYYGYGFIQARRESRLLS